MPSSDVLEIIPVFRIQAKSAFPESPRSAQGFADHVRTWAESSGTPEEIQIDFDCPDRLLGEYADFLESAGEALSPTRLSITALAAWPSRPEFERLAGSVKSLAPMFYDLLGDDPAAVRVGNFQPMADPKSADLIRAWKGCPSPWFAGLPNFERVSVFATDGSLIGHLRGWEHDPLFHHPDLRCLPLDYGTTLFEVKTATDLADKNLTPVQLLAHRTPASSILQNLVTIADESGSSGILYFTLPGPGIQTAFSVDHLTHLARNTTPELAIEILEDGRIALTNTGQRDLPTHNWALALHSDESLTFRSASPGAFAMLETPDGSPVEFSDSITLHFTRLPAGQSITSGPLIQNHGGLSWKIPGLTEKSSRISIR